VWGFRYVAGEERMADAANIYVAVVEDDESLRRSLCRLLRLEAFQPIAYASAQALLDDEKGPRFDCLILDMQLADMNGIELYQRLLADGGSVRVVFISGGDDEELKAQAQALGCVGYFRKTDPGSAIVAAIRSGWAPARAEDASGQGQQ
jgi:FixJ family two-component response regulator